MHLTRLKGGPTNAKIRGFNFTSNILCIHLSSTDFIKQNKSEFRMKNNFLLYCYVLIFILFLYPVGIEFLSLQQLYL